MCGAVLIAAGMLKEDWLKGAARAMMLGIGLYLIPLAMISNPDLIELSCAPGAAITTALEIGIGLAAVSYWIIASNVITLRVMLIALGLAALFVPLDILGAQP